MAKYSLEIKPSAAKELDALDNALFPGSTAKSSRWLKIPAPGYKKLRGYKDQWRIRLGDWRVVYIIDDDAKRVSITRVAHRREVYE